MDDKTLLAQAGLQFNDATGAVSVPIFQSATFRHPELGRSTGYDYSRTGNPTRTALEIEIAKLDQGYGATAFSTGMAALGAVCHLLKSGDHLVVSDDLYGGTWRLLDEIFAQFGLSASYVPTGDLAKVQAAIRPATKLLLVETPSNPCMNISDLQALGGLAKAANLLYVVDNTFMTAYAQKPLAFGADLVVYSGTKFIAGHNDTLCGFVVAKTADLDARIKFVQNAYGAVLAPFDSWLVLRGLKTLALRLDCQSANAAQIAESLRRHPKVTQVYYPGLADHPGYAIHAAQSTMAGAMLSVRVASGAVAARVINSVKVFSFAESLGGVESLITYPMTQTHAAMPVQLREQLGITDTLLRVSVGIEAADDLIRDLHEAIG